MTIDEAEQLQPGDKVKIVNIIIDYYKGRGDYRNGDILIVDDPPTIKINGILVVQVIADIVYSLLDYIELYDEERKCKCEWLLVLYQGCKCGGK